MSVSSESATYHCPAGMNLGQWMGSRMATRATRSYDWNAQKFPADFDPKHARAQMRHVGTPKPINPTYPPSRPLSRAKR